ncbi:MAG: hypothetical protein R3Y68_06885 [Rikenellaceae bacterium]
MKRILLLFVAVVAAASGELSAQKLTMGFIYPAGGEQGSSVVVEIGGLNLKDATSVILSGDGVSCEIVPLEGSTPQKTKSKRLTDQSAPQLSDRVGVRVDIAADATPGLRSLRLQSPKGVSNQLSFEVSQYPNFVESQSGEPNIVESLPATLCGYVKSGEVDRFEFDATKGMMIVAEVKGRALVPYIADAVPGWFQPVVRIVNSRGEEVAYGDDYLTSPDPVVRFKVAADDRYTLSINDAIFRGREDFNYRIQLGEIPFVESLYPIVAKVGERSKMEVSGCNIANSSVKIKPTESGVNYLTADDGRGDISNRVPYWVAQSDEVVVMNPESGCEVASGQLIYDCIESPYEQRRYSVEVEEGESFVLEAISRRVGSSADLRMTLLDPKGDSVAESDDVEDITQGLMTHHADPQISYRAKSSGRHTLIIEEVLGKAGREYGYILRRGESAAPFDAFVSPANLTISQGGTASFLVNFEFEDRKRSGVSHVELEGLPDGYRVSSLKPTLYPSVWEISVTTPVDAELGTFPVEVNIHTAPRKGSDEEPTVLSARPTDKMMQAFYYNHYIAAESFTVEIVPAIPYSVSFAEELMQDLDKPIAIDPTMSTLPLKIRVERRGGYDGEIELAMGKKIREITIEPVTIAADEKEATIVLKVNQERLNKLKQYRRQIYFTASVNGEIQIVGKRTFQNALYKDMTPIVTIRK